MRVTCRSRRDAGYRFGNRRFPHYCARMRRGTDSFRGTRRGSATAVVLATILVATATAASAADPLHPLPAQSPDVPWPTRQWPTGPLPAGVSQTALEELLKVVPTAHPILGQTRAVLIV